MIRRNLGPYSSILKTDRIEVSLDSSQVSIDLDDARSEAFLKIAHGRELLEGIDIKSDGFEEWLRAERSRLRIEARQANMLDASQDQAIASVQTSSATRTEFDQKKPDSGEVRAPEPQLLFADPRSSGIGLDMFIAELITSQLARTATQYSRINVVTLDGKPTSSVQAPGSRCTVHVTRNKDRMMVLARLAKEPSNSIFWSRQIDFDISDDLGAIDAAAALAFEATEAVAACAEEASEAALANAMAASALQDVFSFDPSRLIEADRLLEEANERDPLATRPALRALAKAFLNLELKQGDTDNVRQEADTLIRESTALDPRNAIALAFIADVYDLVMEDSHMALSFAERALQLNPGTGYAYASLGGLELRRGRGEQAFKAADRARRQLENTSLQVFSLMRFCLAAMHMGYFDAAIAAAERAALLAPTSRPPLRHLYALRLRAGDRMGARQALLLLRKLEPDFSLSMLREVPEYPAATLRSTGLDQLEDVDL